MNLSEQRYATEVIEFLERMSQNRHKQDNIPFLPLSAIAGLYGMRFLNSKDCATLLEIENKILNGYDSEERENKK